MFEKYIILCLCVWNGSFVAQTAELAVSGLNPSILLPIVEHCKVIEKMFRKEKFEFKEFFPNFIG